MTKDELITKLAMALTDVMEGQRPHDIVAMTGCSGERAAEIYGLVQMCLESTGSYGGYVYVDRLMWLVSEAQQ